MKIRYLAALLLLGGALCNCCAEVGSPPSPLPAAIEPTADTVWTSTREVRDLKPLASANGVWAATSGGVLQFDGRKWVKWTRRDGLPSHEALEVQPGTPTTVLFSTATSQLINGKWQSESAPPWKKQPLEFMWKGQKVRVALGYLQFGEQSFAIPPRSSGTHISAVLDTGATLLVALYGDGLWNFDGAKWDRAVTVPPGAREITALAKDGLDFWIGTRRNGIFQYKSHRWQQWLQPDEPFVHNIQNFAAFRGVLWASTLDDGLIYRSGEKWGHVAMPTLSSSAPRQMLVWKDTLYVRHGGGVVDSFDGRTWTRNAFQAVPRRKVYALAGDAKTLYAASWGGWSEWNGAIWTPHFDRPELQGVQLMGLLVDSDNLWIATQSRGLGRYNRATKEFRWFDERDGLPDDWVTTLTLFDGKVYAGTFGGGLARLDGQKWKTFNELKGQNVTALAETKGHLFAATRTGLWQIVGDEAAKVNKSWLDDEAQALYPGKNGLWVGTRTSVTFLVSEGL